MKKWTFFSALCCCLFSLSATVEAVTNPFGSNVIIFDPSQDPNGINQTIQNLYDQQRWNEFGEQRYVLLFMPGTYGNNQNIDVKVGYYTQVLGAGVTPNDTIITGAVRTQDRPPTDPNHPEQGPAALTTFWRGCENIAIIPTLGSISYPDRVPTDQNVWAVSQAAPFRRVRIKNGSLRLYDLGWSSGGYLGDCRIDNQIISGTQQQWLTRNTAFANWEGYNWNMVFVGPIGNVPVGTWPNPSYSVIEKSPVIREKPYLLFDKTTQQWAINKRTLRRNVAGTDWHIEGTNIPITEFHIVNPSTSVAEINAALAQGKHILFTPGVYHLNDTITVTRVNTILFGLGFPTLVSATGKPAMVINDVDGVSLAGLIFDAGQTSAKTLLQVGQGPSTVSHTKNPTFLYDIFFRVGGPNYSGKCETCLTVNSNDVVLDHTWIWRADHGDNVSWWSNTADTGIVVNGNNIVAYNLMVEHFQKNQVIWNGENGQVFNFQCEAPYDVPNQSGWNNGSTNGYASYKVGNNVNNHSVIGMGIYTFFRDAPVWMQSAIEAPKKSGISLQHIILFWLSGDSGSGIRHVVNNDGNGVNFNNRRSDFVSWPQ